MTLQEAFDEGFEAVKGYVDRSFDDFGQHIRKLKKQLRKADARLLAIEEHLTATRKDTE